MDAIAIDAGATSQSAPGFWWGTVMSPPTYDFGMTSTTKPAHRVREIYLLGPVASGWQMVAPLRIAIENNSDGIHGTGVVASDDVFAMYGEGKTLQEAQRDYVNSLIDYYELLSEHTGDDPANARLFARLNNYLRRFDPDTLHADPS